MAFTEIILKKETYPQYQRPQTQWKVKFYLLIPVFFVGYTEHVFLFSV